jgi:hypothetical protein
MSMNEAIVALIAAIFGGAGLKAIEATLSRSKARSDVATQIRDELRVEVRELREEVRAIGASLDDWKSRYYRLLVGFNELKYQLLQAGHHDAIKIVEQKMEEEDGPMTEEIKRKVE